MEKDKVSTNQSLLHDFDTKPNTMSTRFIASIIIIALVGFGTGYILAKNRVSTNVYTTSSGTVSGGIAKGTIVGSNDTKTFKDSTEGVLEEGGIEGEGQYHLVRPGGISQYVYLTSSLVDLSQFLKRKIKVRGETHTAQKAGWLMDVGQVEVLE